MEEKNLTLRKYGRVPQSFVFDSRALFKKYDDSAAIIQDLMIFYSYNRLNVNLFGEFEFTIKDFCEAMGYERTTLQRTITELKDPPTLNDHVFDSVFEYALFRSLKEVVIVTRRREGRLSRAAWENRTQRVLLCKRHNRQDPSFRVVQG